MIKGVVEKFVPSIFLRWYHFLLAFFGAVLYRFPSRRLKVIGVTGTNGKSTVVELADRILEEAGYKVASVSSIKFKLGPKEWKNDLKMTMPGRLKLQKFLRKAVNNGCQYAVLEVTSEGILQYRHRFINFDIAVFTNLSPEHIERHGSFEKYREAKGELFRAAKKVHIINLDDKSAEYFLQIPAIEKISYGIKQNVGAQNYKFIKASNIELSKKGVEFTIGNTKFCLNLIGEFNVYNALAAVCVGISQGIDLGICKRALEKIRLIPGRMEMVIAKPFKVYVDYAHTPDSLRKVYETLINLKPKIKNQEPKMICVLGACGGGRDKWKRPVLGKLASMYCDKVIITNEDPYDEDPMEIINQVAEGAEGKAEKVLDRKRAIREAIKMAKTGDVVVITGKGLEPWMCIAGGKKIPWDDRKIAQDEFKREYSALKS